MVARAGLPNQDMEFVQFHPTGTVMSQSNKTCHSLEYDSLIKDHHVSNNTTELYIILWRLQ